MVGEKFGILHKLESSHYVVLFISGIFKSKKNMPPKKDKTQNKFAGRGPCMRPSPLLYPPSRRVWMQHTALSSAPLFVDDVMAESDRAVLSLRKNLAVQGDLILGQD